MLFSFLPDCENDLILKHEGLDFTQYPPENDKNGQILDPRKLEQLPESRRIGDGQDRITDLHFQTEVLNVACFPHNKWLLQESGHCNQNVTVVSLGKGSLK